MYVVASAVKKLVKENGKRCSAQFLEALERHVERVVTNAAKYHNGGKKTVDIEVAAYCGIK